MSIYITNYGLLRPILDYPWSSMLLQIGDPKLNSKVCFSFMFSDIPFEISPVLNLKSKTLNKINASYVVFVLEFFYKITLWLEALSWIVAIK